MIAIDTYDELERRSQDEREADLFGALRRQVAQAKQNAPYFADLLGEVDPQALFDRGDLARLPVTRKSDLIALQERNPPFGGLVTVPAGRLNRIFMSPGPIYEPEPRETDAWRSARSLYASGFRSGDVIHNCFSYHLTPAGALFEGGAMELGCAVIPAGTGSTELQARVIAQVRPNGYVGTPDYLGAILETGHQFDLDCSSIVKAHVTGGPYLPDVRNFYEARKIDVYQSYGTADLGIVAYETPAREGMVVEESVVVEIVRPGTGTPVAQGEIGEVVVTTLNPAYPLIRFATGDLSASLPGPSPCGRTNMRLKGWLGRADQVTKVRGQFVHPRHVDMVLGRHPELRKARLVVTRDRGRDVMTLLCTAQGCNEGLAAAVRDTVVAVTKLKSTVRFVATDEMPDDGKLIEDAR